MSTENRCAPDWPKTDLGMSNLEGIIDDGLEDALRRGEIGTHSAWRFCGSAVWFEDGEFHEEVWQYHAHIATVSAPSLRGLMDEVNNRFGWE